MTSTFLARARGESVSTETRALLARAAPVATAVASPLTMFALDPVWVPHPPGYVPKAKRRGRADAKGPNGEPAESGKWRLRFPDGTIYIGPTLSVSAIETASDCLCKWGLDRIRGFEKPSSDSAERGAAAHLELETWQRYGTRPTIEGMSSVLSEFPPPGESEPEVYFGMVFGRPGHEVIIAGYLDARESITDTVRMGEDQFVAEGRMNSTVRDLKTTGDWRWVKSATQLQANLQAAAYALGEMLRVDAWRQSIGSTDGLCEGVILKWTYALIKLNKDESFRITRVQTTTETDEEGADAGVWMSREQAVAVLTQYLPLAEKLWGIILRHEVHGGENISEDELPKNAEACSMYGGCGWKKIEVCVPPAGGGFRSMLKQERARLGIDTGPSQVLVQIATTTSAKTTKSTKSTESKMVSGLAARFGKKTNGAVNGATVMAEPIVEQAAPAKPVATSAGGLGARFGKKAAPAETVVAAAPAAPVAAAPAAPTKLEQKATADGMSATTPVAAPAGDTLQDRLKALNKGAPVTAAAVETAIATAPTHAVGASVGALAVGINPPDAAPEWTLEQQAAEAARLAGVKPAAADGADAPKRGRGRPAGTTAAVVASAYTVAQAAAEADAIAGRLLAAGFRKEAMLVLTVTEQLGA